MSDHEHICKLHGEGLTVTWNDLFYNCCPDCEAVETLNKLVEEEASAQRSSAEVKAAERVTERALEPLPELPIDMPTFKGGGCVSPPSCKHYEPVAERTLGQFTLELDRMLGPVALEKGYGGNGEVSDVVKQLLGTYDYNLGEIITKVVRWKKKGNEDDLLKIAGHVYLIWRRGK